MSARFRMGIDISGWMRKSARLKSVVANLPKIRLGYEGNHSVLHQANESIARHALAHGDDLWMFEPATLKGMAELVRDGLVGVARRTQRDVDAEMQEACDMAREEVYYNIFDGKIDGPSRTAEWNAYKAAHWAAPTPNMIASREWLDSLTAELVER